MADFYTTTSTRHDHVFADGKEAPPAGILASLAVMVNLSGALGALGQTLEAGEGTFVRREELAGTLNAMSVSFYKNATEIARQYGFSPPDPEDCECPSCKVARAAQKGGAA